jgi:hypothetical protein
MTVSDETRTSVRVRGMSRGREEGREGGRDGEGREGGRERGREGGREGGLVGGREERVCPRGKDEEMNERKEVMMERDRHVRASRTFCGLMEPAERQPLGSRWGPDEPKCAT